MSRHEADLIAVLIFTYDSTPFADPFWWNRILWDESRLRVPHTRLLVAEQAHFYSALSGGRIDFDPFNTDVCREPSEFSNPH